MSRNRTVEDSRRDYQTLLRRVGRDELNKRARDWRLANPEKHRAALAKSRKGHPERNLLNKARGNAKRLGVAFDLTLDDIEIPSHCPLLEVPIDPWGHKDVCPSLDRIDSSKGYVKGNINVVSWKANRMKNTATLEELLTFCKNGLQYYKDVVKYS